MIDIIDMIDDLNEVEQDVLEEKDTAHFLDAIYRRLIIIIIIICAGVTKNLFLNLCNKSTKAIN